MDFLCFLWRGRHFDRPVATYSIEHVITLEKMLARHGGHTLTCVHDGVELPPWIGSIRMPDDVVALDDYLPKLWAWSPELHQQMPGRFACIDLDVVILDDVAPVLATDDPILIWDSAVGEPYNSSLVAITPGHGQEVWTSLTAARLNMAKRLAQRWTGDQSWVAFVLGTPGAATFGEDTGIIRYRPLEHREAPPSGTRAAFLCGPYCPRSESQKSPWIKRHWN